MDVEHGEQIDARLMELAGDADWLVHDARNIRPRNCGNGADGDIAASIKPSNLRKWLA
jgi:hypothetical protein